MMSTLFCVNLTAVLSLYKGLSPVWIGQLYSIEIKQKPSVFMLVFYSIIKLFCEKSILQYSGHFFAITLITVSKKLFYH